MYKPETGTVPPSHHSSYSQTPPSYGAAYNNNDLNAAGALLRMIWDFAYEKWSAFWYPPLPYVHSEPESLKRQTKPVPLVDLKPQNQTIKKAAVAKKDPQIGVEDENGNVLTSKIETTAGDVLSLESKVIVNGLKTLEGMDNGILSADNTTVRYYTHNQTTSYQSPTPVDGAYPLDANTAAVISGNTVTPVNMTNSTQSYYSRFFSQAPSRLVRDPFSQTQTMISGNSIDEYDTAQLVREKSSASPQANNVAFLPDGKLAVAAADGLKIFTVDPQGNFNLINSTTTGPLKGCIVSGNGIYTIENSRNVLRFDATTYQQTSNVTLPGPTNDLVVADLDMLWATGNNVVYECSNTSSTLVYSRSISVPGEGSINKAENNNGVVHLATANGYRLMHETGALLGRVNIAGGASGVAYSSNFPNYTWVAGNTAGVVCVDTQNTLGPTIVSALPMPGVTSGIAIPQNGNKAVVTTDQGIFDVDISNPQNMTMPTGTFSSNVKSPVIANSTIYTAGSVQAFNLNTEPKRTETLSLPPKQILHSLTHTYRLYDSYIEVRDKVTQATVGTWNSPSNLTRMKWIDNGQNNQLAAGHDGGIVVLDANPTDIKALQNIRCGGKLEDFAIFKNNIYLSNSSDCNKTTPDPGDNQINVIIDPASGILNINITDANMLPINTFDNLQLQANITGGQLINVTTGLPINNFTPSQANQNQIKLVPFPNSTNGATINGFTGNDGGIQIELHPVVKKFDPVFNPQNSEKLPLGLIIGVAVGTVACMAASAIAWYVRVQKKLGKYNYKKSTAQQCNLFWCGDKEIQDDDYNEAQEFMGNTRHSVKT